MPDMRCNHPDTHVEWFLTLIPTPGRLVCFTCGCYWRILPEPIPADGSVPTRPAPPVGEGDKP